MRTIFLVSCIITVFISLVGGGAVAQDSLPEILIECPRQSIMKVGLNSSFGIANGRNLAGTWHKANLSGGTNLQLGVRVSDNFWINAGASLDFHRYRSAPFVHSGSYHVYSSFNQGSWVNLKMILNASPKGIQGT